jgi:hypothetical protein
MTRRQKDPLRPLTEEERALLEQISRAQSEPASHIARARALLSVADGRRIRRLPNWWGGVVAMSCPNG